MQTIVDYLGQAAGDQTGCGVVAQGAGAEPPAAARAADEMMAESEQAECDGLSRNGAASRDACAGLNCNRLRNRAA
ncbi:hypothetical protein ACVIGA_000056 [Bradyrhizobium sp. USDA 3240]